LRDGIAGIGTVTYYDPESGAFGALGHGVEDPETSSLLPINKGRIVPSEVVEVVKGKRGQPGALRGRFDVHTTLGTITDNTDDGLFGSATGFADLQKAFPLAESEEVKTGAATILSNVEGTLVEEYAVEIVRVFDEEASGRNLLLTITDPKLLEVTGGIVQGMSGSPIIQNGRIVGAVTHVCVNL